jgi:type I restriction enzyme, S subunit
MSSSTDMENCCYLPLTDVLKFIVDNRGKTVPTAEEGIPLIATNCIKNNELYPVFEKVRFISNETYKTWFRAHPVPGDIIFVNKGTPGRVCLVPNPVNFCIAQDMMAFRVDEKKVYNKYLFAVLRSAQFQAQITNYHVGTLIPHFKKGDLNKLMIPIPSKYVQRFIGDFYLSFSRKIEINNQINKKLEEMAQVLFKQWFVDFEFPNEHGEPYLSDGGLMDKVGDNKLVPIGWKERALYDLCEYINGTSFKKVEVSEKEGIPIIKIAELKQGISDSTKYFIGFKPEKYNLNNGDILFSWSGNPETSIDIFIWSNGKGILNQHIFKIETSEFNKEFIYVLLKYFKPIFTQVASNKQTTGLGHVTVSDLKRLRIFLPSNDLLNHFANIISPIVQKIYKNNLENNILKNLQEALLPKLMSGEIRVPIES